ncbi:hypothetical protein GCM10009616_14820 [Microlunatus lacustris]
MVDGPGQVDLEPPGSSCWPTLKPGQLKIPLVRKPTGEEDAAMNLACAVGRHRWVTRQGKSELGERVTYQQCERCRHYPRTSSSGQREGLRWEPRPPEYQGGSGGVGSGQ